MTSTTITLDAINAIFSASFPNGKGFEHNNSNDAIIDDLNRWGVTADDVREYTTTSEFIAHEHGYHALRGLRAWAKAKYSPRKSTTKRSPRKAKAPKKDEPRKDEPRKDEPRKDEPKKDGTHKKFMACLSVLNVAKRPLLMTGPAGSGKSYTAAAVAEACGATEFFTQSKVCFETDLRGYMDAYGNYVPTALYRAMKRADGGDKTAYFLDEIFAGDTSCLTVINDLLSDNKMTFPNGETLSANNLVIMAADNTNGNGATNQYNTRNKADKSFLNRFGCIHIDYDKDIEKKLAGDHAEILEFVRAIRAAAERVDLDIVCSYRTISSMAAYADAGIDAAEAIEAFVYQDALTDDDKDTLRMDSKIERLIQKGNVYACAL